MLDQYDPYVQLASEIVLYNVKRYISAGKHYRKFGDPDDIYEMKEIERWFYSDRFKLYCHIHPDRIMEYIRKELSNV